MIEDWETKNLVMVGTVSQAKGGKVTKPGTVLLIAKAMGASEKEAQKIAEDFSEAREEPDSA